MRTPRVIFIIKHSSASGGHRHLCTVYDRQGLATFQRKNDTASQGNFALLPRAFSARSYRIGGGTRGEIMARVTAWHQ